MKPKILSYFCTMKQQAIRVTQIANKIYRQIKTILPISNKINDMETLTITYSKGSKEAYRRTL